MRILTIDRVDHDERALEALVGRSVDLPRTGQTQSGRSLSVQGWALGRSQRIVGVEAVANGIVTARTIPRIARFDVAAAFPDVPNSLNCGFSMEFPIPPAGLKGFDVRAVLADGSIVPLATLRTTSSWKEANRGAPFVSVVIPCYRQARFLADAIESALAQTYPHFEIVVVDDGSPDNASRVAARFPEVRCVRQENKGLAAARNTGIRHTLGDYLVFLDSDDRLLPNALQAQLDLFAASPDAAFVCGSAVVIDVEGRRFGEPLTFSAADPYAALLAGGGITTPGCIMFRRSVFDSFIGFSEFLKYRGCEDLELYFRISRDFAVASHDEIVLEYRQHGCNMSSNALAMATSVLATMYDQRPFVRRNPQWNYALRVGIDRYRTILRGHLVCAADGHWLRRDRLGFLRCAAMFAWSDPIGLARYLLGRPNVVRRRDAKASSGKSASRAA